jgi:hypothetical protein
MSKVGTVRPSSSRNILSAGYTDLRLSVKTFSTPLCFTLHVHEGSGIDLLHDPQHEVTVKVFPIYKQHIQFLHFKTEIQPTPCDSTKTMVQIYIIGPLPADKRNSTPPVSLDLLHSVLHSCTEDVNENAENPTLSSIISGNDGKVASYDCNNLVR